MDTNQNLLTDDLHIDSSSQSYLLETAKWGNFLSIIGFIGSGILVLVALFSGTLLGAVTSGYGGGGALMGAGVLMAVYLIIAVIYFFMSLYLYKFSSKMKIALQSTDQNSLSDAFLNLKNLYRLTGIIAVVYLSLLALGLIVGIGAAAFGR
jgi:hypothetical protein